MMVGNLLRLHRAEGSQTNMKGNESGADSLGPNFIQQLLGKVQTCRGRRSGTHLPGVDRLIPLLIFQFRLNVGRQWHLAQPLQNFQENPLIVEFHHPVPVFPDLPDSGCQFAVAKNDLVSRLHFPSGLAQALPALVPQVPQQKHLHHTASGAMTHQPGGQHPGIIHHQAVPRLQVLHNIIKMPVGHFSGPAVQNHQPGSVPPLQRRLGNQLFRQVIVKVAGFQIGSSFLFGLFSIQPVYRQILYTV